MPDCTDKVCPWCSHRLHLDGVCPSCGKKLDPGDWPVAAAYSIVGLSPYGTGDGAVYALPVPPEAPHASLGANACFPRDIPPQDALSFGTGPGDSVRIEASVPVRAVFYRNRRSKECWVLDDGRVASLSVNGEPVRNARLRPDDLVCMAGIAVRFNGEAVNLERNSGDGITLSAGGLGVSVGGRDILRNISFSVRPGEFVGILGPSGCGKSTLLQCLAGLVDPRHRCGSIRFDGIDSEELPDGAVGLCAYLPQNAEEMLHPGLTLQEEMKCFLAVHGIGSAEEANIDPLLALLGLADESGKPVSKLSGGQKRRAAIAMTLLRKPKIVLLDEPTAGLDPASDAEVMRYLRKVAANKRIAIMCSTHVLGNMDCFTRIMALTGARGAKDKNGRLVFCGLPGELVKNVCPNLDHALAGRNLLEVYETLLDGAPGLESLPGSGVREGQRRIKDVCQPPPGAGASFMGYLKRMWKAFRPAVASGEKRRGGGIAEFFAPVADGLRLLASAPAFLFLWMPLGVVACIRIGCADDFFTPATGAIYFKCIIALFLLGLCHSATRLVDGRIPGRCLERLAGVSASAYLAAKIAGSAGLCAVQTISFCAFWELSVRLPPDWFSNVAVNTAPAGPMASMWTVPVLFAVSLIGSFAGLSVSAMVKSRATAVNIVPVFAVVVLFFSQPNIGYPLSDVANANRSRPPAAAELVSYCTPTVFPQRFLASAYQVAAARRAAEGARDERAARSAGRHLDKVLQDFRCVGMRLLALIVFYFALAYCLMWCFEPARERQWNGR